MKNSKEYWRRERQAFATGPGRDLVGTELEYFYYDVIASYTRVLMRLCQDGA